MAWETRHGKGLYYTRTIRRNGRFAREYIGTGPEAELAAALDASRRAERVARAEAQKAEQARWHGACGLLRQFDRLADTLLRASLLAAGFHQHDRGAWRRTCYVHGNRSENPSRPTGP
jgi:hypothetical protein